MSKILPENNVQYLRPKVFFFSFQVQLNADMNIELHVIYAVLLHVLFYKKCSFGNIL